MALPSPLLPCSAAHHRGMKTTTLIFSLLSLSYFTILSFATSPILHGIHPLDVKYFESKVIKCKDGSNSFTKDRLNDDFCDCLDGTDEPGTSACPNGKFYCRNLGSTPRFVFSSHVNDHICDCCDGSDEYDGIIYCPNTCIMGGSIEYKAEYHHKTSFLNAQAKESKLNGKSDMIQSLKDLKVLALFQLIVIAFILALWLFYHRIKSRRRRCR